MSGGKCPRPLGATVAIGGDGRRSEAIAIPHEATVLRNCLDLVTTFVCGTYYFVLLDLQLMLDSLNVILVMF